jgi:predicted DNA-binding transcriptional regulator AlpA
MAANEGALMAEKTTVFAHHGEQHLTIEQLAEREGVPAGTVRQWNSRGTGPQYMRIGRYVRYRLADVIAWEQSRTVVPLTLPPGASGGA